MWITGFIFIVIFQPKPRAHKKQLAHRILIWPIRF